jgi:small ligand-binding sensory domain FIST
MNAVGVGHSVAPDAETAGQAAVRTALDAAGLSQAEHLFLFATTHYARGWPALLKAARDTAGARNLVGCSGMGVLTSAGEIEGGPAVAAMAIDSDSAELRPYLARPGAPDGDLAGYVASAIGPGASEGAALVMLPDIFNLRPVHLLERLGRELKGLPVVGGAASGEAGSPLTYQWCNDQVSTRGASGALLVGDIALTIGIAQGCMPIGQPYVITTAQGNVIMEIAGKPALQVIRETLASLGAEELDRAQRSLFAGLAVDERQDVHGRGDFLVRNIVGIDPRSGAVMVGDLVRPGQTFQLHLRDRQAAREDLEMTLAKLAAVTDDPPSFGLYFNCLGRGSGLYGEPNHDIEAISQVLGDVPVAGFFGNAELAPMGGRNLVHNYKIGRAHV